MAEIPNLKSVVTKEMVKTIGTGRYAAEYVPWSKIAELLNEHAPGWQPELIPQNDGSILHLAPVGAYLMIGFRHLDGTKTTAYPQAIQDNRHAAIPLDKIDARDISDTQRRGFCLAAAAVFSLGIELWTRDPLESGYSRALEESPNSVGTTPPTAERKGPELPKETSARQKTEAQFVAAAKKVGLSELAIDVIKSKIKGNWSAGISTLATKTPEEIATINKNAG
jgi:hypothetical protein